MKTEVDLNIQAAARENPGTVSLTNLFETLYPRLDLLILLIHLLL